LLKLASRVGEAIAQRGWTLVSGGGNVSSMGAVAGGARARRGHTVGVIPKALVHRAESVALGHRVNTEWLASDLGRPGFRRSGP